LKEQKKHENKGLKRQGSNGVNSKLVCRKIRGSYQYYIDQKYVSKKKEISKICEMAKAEYREKLLPILELEITYLKRVLQTEERLTEVYRRMHEGKQALFEPDCMPIDKKISDFEQVIYKGLGFDESDRTEYITNKGERVRSKSEKIIADELARHQIPYKYEKPLQLIVDGKMKEFYPDFTVLNRTTGETKYIEHLGMMDAPSYYKNVLSKLDVYEKNGLLIGRDVILFHESSYQPLNTRVVTDYINEFLM
jgi:hypothetical protein